MDQPKPFFKWQTGSSQPVSAGEMKVTPQAQALIVRWQNGGFVWNRPVAVIVERPGQTQRIPIVDITRFLQWSLLATSAVCWIGLLLVRRQRKEEIE